MHMKPKVVIRILALLTTLEALGALLAVGLSVSTYSLVKESFGVWHWDPLAGGSLRFQAYFDMGLLMKILLSYMTLA